MLNKKSFFLLLFIAAFAPLLWGQELQKRNTVYLELGGNALFTSFNYERQLLKNTGLTIHAGAGMYGLSPSYITFPFGINYLIKLSASDWYLDVGAGITYSKADVKLYLIVEPTPYYVHTNYWNYVPHIGIRKTSKKNFMYRLTLSPVLNHWGFIPFAGIAIGKIF